MASALLSLLKAVELSKKAATRKIPGKIGGSKSARTDVDPSGTALEHDVPGKLRVDAVEEEFNALKKSDDMKGQPDEVINDIAEQNVNEALARVKPKRSFVGAETSKTGVAGKKRVQRGRRDAIIRGEQKYMPRGNRADDSPQALAREGEDTQPSSLNREELSDPRLSRKKVGATSAGDRAQLNRLVRRSEKVPKGKSGLEETVDLPANFNRLDAGDQRKIMKPRDTREEQRIAIARINKAEEKGRVKREEDLARENEAIAQENRESGEFFVEEFSGDVPLNKARRINNELSGDEFSATGGSAKDRAALEQLDDLFGDNREIAVERIRKELELHSISEDLPSNRETLNLVISNVVKEEQAGFRVQEIMALFEELRGLVPKEQFLPVWRKASQLAEIIRGSKKKNVRPSPERLGELETLLDSISQMPK